jgi:hypothetical protein
LETSAPSAIAVPPALWISSTTASAGVSEPAGAIARAAEIIDHDLGAAAGEPSACARPRPLPAPVTIATRPSNLIAMRKIPLLSSWPGKARKRVFTR